MKRLYSNDFNNHRTSLFGLSGLNKVLDDDKGTWKKVSNTFYMVPEVLTGKYNEKYNILTYGVIL